MLSRHAESSSPPREVKSHYKLVGSGGWTHHALGNQHTVGCRGLVSMGSEKGGGNWGWKGYCVSKSLAVELGGFGEECQGQGKGERKDDTWLSSWWRFHSDSGGVACGPQCSDGWDHGPSGEPMKP